MQGLEPVTMQYLLEKARKASLEQLLVIWDALDGQDLNLPYSVSNAEITLFAWAQIVKSERDIRFLERKNEQSQVF